MHFIMALAKYCERGEIMDPFVQVNAISVFLSAVCAVFMVIIAIRNKKIQKEMLARQKEYNIASLCPKCDIVCSEANAIKNIRI